MALDLTFYNYTDPRFITVDKEPTRHISKSLRTETFKATLPAMETSLQGAVIKI